MVCVEETPHSHQPASRSISGILAQGSHSFLLLLLLHFYMFLLFVVCYLLAPCFFVFLSSPFFFIDSLLVVIKFDVSQFEANVGEITDEMKRAGGGGGGDMPANSGVRNSLSSLSSVEVELNDNDDLSTIPELDDSFEKSSQTCEIFAVPKAKHSNSIIRWVSSRGGVIKKV